MKLYLQKYPRLNHEPPVPQSVRNVPDKNLLHDRVIEFIQFSGKNANSFTDYVVCFDENADAGSQLQLLRNDRLTLPIPPTDLTVKKCGAGKLLLTWKFIPDPMLRGFSIEHRPVGHSDWTRIESPEVVGRIEMKLLKLNYQFRVACLCVPGQGPFSQIVSIK